jgi:hypothetical protein
MQNRRNRSEIAPDAIPAPEYKRWDELLAIDGALDRLAVTDNCSRSGQAALLRRVFEHRGS